VWPVLVLSERLVLADVYTTWRPSGVLSSLQLDLILFDSDPWHS